MVVLHCEPRQFSKSRDFCPGWFSRETRPAAARARRSLAPVNLIPVNERRRIFAILTLQGFKELSSTLSTCQQRDLFIKLNDPAMSHQLFSYSNAYILNGGLSEVLTLASKARNGLAPSYYISLLITDCAPARALRSSDFATPAVLRFKPETVGDRYFCSIAPGMWNCLQCTLARALACHSWHCFYRASVASLGRFTHLCG